MVITPTPLPAPGGVIISYQQNPSYQQKLLKNNKSIKIIKFYLLCVIKNRKNMGIDIG